MPYIRAYLQLVRLPAVFTAMADIFAGFLLTHESLSPLTEFLSLLGASSALYLAGMALNDVFDRKTDARERPHRPIPSGRVSVAAGTGLGIVLLAAGLGFAFLGGAGSLAIVAPLAALILAYDGFVKRTILGPAAMGGCRLLNVLLGASTSPSFSSGPQFSAAFALGVYVAGATWFARGEAKRSSREQLLGATMLVHLGLAAFAATIFTTRGAKAEWAAVAALAIIAVTVDGRIVPALLDSGPEKVQAAVKILLLAIVLLDATMVYLATADLAFALATAALAVPAATLGRWIYIT